MSLICIGTCTTEALICSIPQHVQGEIIGSTFHGACSLWYQLTLKVWRMAASDWLMNIAKVLIALFTSVLIIKTRVGGENSDIKKTNMSKYQVCLFGAKIYIITLMGQMTSDWQF